MAVVQWERHETVPFDLSGQGTSLTRNWFVGGTTDETTVYLTVLLAAPIVYDNLVRDGIRAEHQGGGNWYVTISYKNIALQQGLPNDGGPGGGGTTPAAGGPATETEFLTPNYAYSTTGGTRHIKLSHGTMERKSATGHTTDDKTRLEAASLDYMLDNERAINSNAEGVGGVDIYAPAASWTVDWTRNSVDKAYNRTITNLTGSVNDDTFYQWPAGAVLFQGAEMRQTNGRWNITYKFAVGENRTGVDIGNGITLEEVKAWEYVWVEYMTKPVGGRLLNVPKTARVEQVYPPKNFELLEIGT